jgi:hypothetical protein
MSQLSQGADPAPLSHRATSGSRCPLSDHDDAHASCQMYPAPEQGWWCFGCQRGGRIYDLATLMSGGPWGRELRGAAFTAARELVAAAVG